MPVTVVLDRKSMCSHSQSRFDAEVKDKDDFGDDVLQAKSRAEGIEKVTRSVPPGFLMM